MITTLTVCQELTQSAVEPNFLEMLPSIRRVASSAFRHLRRAIREDLIAEVVANAFVAFKRLLARGRAALAYPTVLAKFAIRQVREGRRVGCRQNVEDAMSVFAQRRKGFSIRPLREQSERGQWQDLVVEDCRATPADLASFRLDFSEWLRRLRPRARAIALDLAGGSFAMDVARQLGVSKARISQVRRELETSWNEFQGVPAAA